MTHPVPPWSTSYVPCGPISRFRDGAFIRRIRELPAELRAGRGVPTPRDPRVRLRFFRSTLPDLSTSPRPRDPLDLEILRAAAGSADPLRWEIVSDEADDTLVIEVLSEEAHIFVARYEALATPDAQSIAAQ